MAEYMDGARWYVAHTYSGYENKVKTNLEKIVENRSLQDKIFDIQIPVMIENVQEGEVSKEVESKVFPSYVLVKMIMYSSYSGKAVNHRPNKLFPSPP